MTYDPDAARYQGRGTSPLYVTVTSSAGKEYRYYHCRVARSDATACPAKRSNADELEMMTEVALLGQCSEVELTESREIPGQDQTEDMPRSLRRTAIYRSWSRSARPSVRT